MFVKTPRQVLDDTIIPQFRGPSSEVMSWIGRRYGGSPVSAASATIAEQSTSLEVTIGRSMDSVYANQLNPA